MVFAKKIFGDQGRISFPAAIGGFLVTMAFIFLSMSFAAGLGYWSYRPQEDVLIRENFWTLASIAWVISVSVGSYVAALAAHSDHMMKGILNSMTAWACSFLFFGGISLHMADPKLYAFGENSNTINFWHGFIADAGAFVAAICAGYLGVLTEKVKIRINGKTKFMASRAAVLNRLDPAEF